jgi:lipoprotein-anchoring transpeptidase ErfK/SrfK
VIARLAIVATAVASAVAVVGWRAETGGVEPASSQLDALAAPARSALQVPRPSRIRSDGVSTWAPMQERVAARAAPSARARALVTIGTRTPEGTANILRVTGARAVGNRVWARVSLPVLPNGTEGWVPRSALGGYTVVDTRLVVSLHTLHATLYRAGRAVLSIPVGVGLPSSPTPRGTFYIRDKLTRVASPFYGPIAFGTSARSEVLTDWPAGGFIGIHGTDQPGLIPGRISHGCIRMKNADILRLSRRMPVGSVVVVRG